MTGWASFNPSVSSDVPAESAIRDGGPELRSQQLQVQGFEPYFGPLSPRRRREFFEEQFSRFPFDLESHGVQRALKRLKQRRAWKDDRDGNDLR